jgi:hypothetical protein
MAACETGCRKYTHPEIKQAQPRPESVLPGHIPERQRENCSKLRTVTPLTQELNFQLDNLGGP